MMVTTTGETTTRDRVLRAAADLLTQGGRAAVSTRAVSAAAGVQPPTLYRLFGDMDHLLDEVASYGFEQYLASKHAIGETNDPLADLRRGWDVHVEFGLSRPAFYALMYGEARTGRESRAAAEAKAILYRMIVRLAGAGRLRMSVERAARLVAATGVGVVFSLLATPSAQRDLELSAIARENVLQAIATDLPARPASETGVAGQAVALREMLNDEGFTVLTDAERALLAEWLDRVADGRHTPHHA